MLKLGRNIALINADTCVGHRRYLRLGLSGHKPDDLAFSFCPDYIYSRSEFRLAGAEERRGTMAEDAVGGIEEDIFIGRKTRNSDVIATYGYCPSRNVIISSA